MKENEKKIKNPTKYGLLLWFLILFGYFLFVFNWIIMNQLQGRVASNTGWESAFFTQTPSTTTSQAINYTITLMRGVGSIGAGIVIAKLGHKKSVLIAMGLVSTSFLAITAGYWHNIGGYVIFIIARMLMAVGGTVLIAYTQPIIASFFKPKGKSMLSRINSFGSNFGTMVPLILFAIPVIQNSMLTHWQTWGFVISIIPLILMIAYWILANDIEIAAQAKGFENSKRKLKESTWKSVAKDKNTWTLSIFFGFWLTTVTAIMLITRDHFNFLHIQNFGYMSELDKQLPAILFLLAVIPGIWAVGWILKTNIDRRLYISIVTGIGALCLIGTHLCTVYVENVAPAAILMFIAGIALWGIQGVFLNNPHEDKANSPQRVGIVVSFAFGVGYVMFTIFNILLAVVFDALKINDYALASWVQLGLTAFFMICAVISALFISKTKPEKLSSLWQKKLTNNLALTKND